MQERKRRSPKKGKEGSVKAKPLSSAAPARVGDVISFLRQTTIWGDHLDHARIWDEWPKLAGALLAKHGYPKSIREKVLYVDTESAVWMHRFALRKWEIIRRINRMYRREVVTDLFIQLASEDSQMFEK